MKDNNIINLTVNIPRNLAAVNPQILAKELEHSIRNIAEKMDESPTAPFKNTVGEVLTILKQNNLTVRQSVNVLKDVEKQILCNLPISSSLDSRFDHGIDCIFEDFNAF
ncbi:hypothetical protein PZE06_20955 [Robertmurraya sp. DFI.2.37]|uniref:hypothetical protein n=1 Tax=Robertmurraya sp. DFI.2.37 TaxID=3031819 RepID=UPI00124658FD|nr:hypothetical protein [Robertmurraya sp. DFI.2.37]MDF1510607.1 hypothetical protein [Robertmurraya sp. DFI.2.37]